jgi:hypothetical protein
MGEWKDGTRRVLQSPAMRGEYLKTNAAMQRALTDAIAQRTGLAGTCSPWCWPVRSPPPRRPPSGAGSPRTRRSRCGHWFAADPPVPLRPLVREVLGQVAQAFTDAARAVQPG